MTMILDNVLEKVRAVVPECLAAGLIDVESGRLLSMRTREGHRCEVVAQLAAATRELFQGENVTTVESTFKRMRGVEDAGHPYFQEIVIYSDDLLHLFQRCKQHDHVVLVTVCRKQADLGMVMAEARSTIEAVDRSI